MRSLIIVCASLSILGGPQTGFSQSAQTGTPAAAAQQNYDPPKAQKPDEATLKQIADKTATLRTAIKELKQRPIADHVLIEVEIYLKAAENIVRFDEWYAPASGKWALATLDQGLEREAGLGRNRRLAHRSRQMDRASVSFVRRRLDPTLRGHAAAR